MRKIKTTTFALGLILVFSFNPTIQNVSAEEVEQIENPAKGEIAEESTLQNQVDQEEDIVDKATSEEKHEQEIIEDKDSIDPNNEIEEKENITETNIYEEEKKSDQQSDMEQENKEVVSDEDESEIDESAVKSVSAKSLYDIGDSGPHVKELKQELVRLGFAKWSNPTEVYGQITANVVKDFQKYYGLTETGKADAATRNKMKAVLNPPYQNRDRGQPVIKLKENLVKLGYANWSNPSQFYGSATEKVVKKFQRANGLIVDGIAGSSTLSKINELLTSRYMNGDRGPHVVELKLDLVQLGFAKWSNPTEVYGQITANVVKDFQRYYGLTETGKADAATRNKMKAVLNPPYQNRDRGQPVIKLKENLVKLGYANWSNPSQFYGSATEKVVKKFQRANGLIVDGIAGSSTLSKINELLTSRYMNGDRGPHVVELKLDLVQLGFAKWSNPTEVYGQITANVVKDFQKYYGLTETGIADSATRNKMKAVLNPPYQNRDRGQPVIKLKENLVKLGYANWSNPSQFYGSATEKVVKDFQRANGLTVDGIAGLATLKKMEDALSDTVKVFIDPGHGGLDSGATAYGLYEKDVVLSIALKLAQELSSYAGIEIMLSRTTDVSISLEERTRMANNWGADFFISLHTNSHNYNANGFESFIYNGVVSKETSDRQNDIHNHVASWLKSNNGINDRGKKRANFHVLRESEMPSLLLEYMFIDNSKENNLLKSKSYREKLGKITADAIVKSFNLKKK
ncbi:peptidoglycan-binding protein [Oceanobacillus sp. AG]|uniref:peptidoglycan-binding protein n=1 Tax=Oceanobacillus sp. AG TaxID=2681969 RepID=UPI0012EB45EF|nr:peptidoglycan-binding protein [Oceanobacillus sp. AG]